MQENYPVMVSIYVATYNHENYIVKALDSILMQKTQYSYEVLVGEDVSTDHTREVLQAYEQKYPGKFQIFYREKNMSQDRITNGLDLKLRCKGKYVIALEGDDFWTDEYKLEKEVRFLEEHPQYIAVAHNCQVVGEDSLPNGESYPECKQTEYTFSHFFDRIMPGQLTTVLCRNYMLMDNFDKSLIMRSLTPGDQLTYFSLLCHGKIYCMQEIMSAYRHVTTHGSSFSATHTFRYEREKEWYSALAEYAYRHCEKWVAQRAEYFQFALILGSALRREVSWSEAQKDLKTVRCKPTMISLAIRKQLSKCLRRFKR